MSPLLYFWLVLKASLLSTSGTGNVPSLHADLVGRGAVGERGFAEALSIGQVSPGPSGLWVVALGYGLDGLRGAAVSTVAVCLPPMLVLGVDALYRRTSRHPGVEGFVWGLGLLVAGVLAAVMLGLVRSAGPSVLPVAIALTALGLSLRGKAPVALVIAAAAVVGLLAL